MRRDLGRLLAPRSAVFIGGEEAERAIRMCDRLGFAGEMWPVNPSREQMGDRPAYRSLADLPAVPDAAFVAVDRHRTVRAVRELAEMGVGGAVLYASGFAETGPEGAALQGELTSGHNMPLIGPNCYGIINAVTGAALWPDVHGCRRVRRGPALLSQSGNLALNLTMNRRGVDFSYVASLGNQASATVEECLEHFAVSPEVTSVGVHLESVADPPRLARALLACRESRTPVAVLKTGRTAAAAAITASHTAALSGPAAAYDAFLDRFGAVRADTLEELLAALAVWERLGPLPGNRVTSLSCSGGEAALVADRAERYGVVFPPFSAGHARRIKDTLSDLVAVTNPLDYHTFIWGDEEALRRCFTEVLTGPAEAGMLILDWPGDEDDSAWWPTLVAFAAAAEAAGTPAMVVSGLSENLPDRVREFAAGRGLAVAYSIDGALFGLEAAARAGDWFNRPPPPPPFPAGEPPPPGSLPALDEAEAKAMLRAAGLSVPAGMAVAGASGREGLARLGFPLVVKRMGTAHKTETGGVICGIADEESLNRALRELGGEGRRVLVERHVTGGVAEVLVAARREWPLGITLTLGAGGTLAELAADTAVLTAPASEEEVVAALAGLRAGRLLAGYRGAPAGDIRAAAQAATRLVDFLVSRPDIVEAEVNPLLVTPDGAWAVDALITSRPP